MNETSFVSELRQKALPTVSLDESIKSPTSPYEVVFDRGRFGDFLRHFGMPEDRIAKLRITFKRKAEIGIEVDRSDLQDFFDRCKLSHGLSSRFLRALIPDEKRKLKIPVLIRGMANMLTGNNITVYTDALWENYTRCAEVVDCIIDGKQQPKKDAFDNWLTTKRLPEFLTRVDSERGRKVAHRLLNSALQRKAEKHIFHESKHVIDRRNKAILLTHFMLYPVLTTVGYDLPPVATKLLADAILHTDIPLDTVAQNPYTIISSLMMSLFGFRLAYKLDPMEARANKFAQALRQTDDWRSILQIRPKVSSVEDKLSS